MSSSTIIMTETEYYQLGFDTAKTFIKSIPKHILAEMSFSTLEKSIVDSCKDDKILADWKRRDRLPLLVKHYWEGVNDSIQTIDFN